MMMITQGCTCLPIKIQIEKNTTTQGYTFLFKINIENKYITQGHKFSGQNPN